MKKCCLLLLCILFCVILYAQQKTVVYGNLGVENVNISVLNTQNGTVSDAKGHYMLLLTEKNKRINLHYSCIGYQDTVVSLLPKQLESDSINISTGQTIPKMRLDVDLFNKVAVYGGHLYLMKRGRTSTGNVRSFVERIDLN